MHRALETAMHAGVMHKSSVRITPSSLMFFTPRLISSFAFVLVIAVVGSSTAYAAEGAVPGDFLYTLKVNISEPIRTALAISSEARAEVHARLAERRMEEAQVLAARGTLTADVKAGLEANFEQHATEVETIVDSVEKDDPVVAANISARFGSSVEANGAVIARLGAEGGDEENRRESENFSLTLRDRGRRIAHAETPRTLKVEAARIAEAAPASEDATTLSMALPADDADAAVIARIELTASTTLEEAENYLATLKDKLDATTSARTKQQIENIRNLIKKLRKAENGSSEKERVERALKDAVTIKTFIKAQAKFHEDVLLPVPDIEEGEGGWKSDDEEKDKSGDNGIELHQ